MAYGAKFLAIAGAGLVVASVITVAAEHSHEVAIVVAIGSTWAWLALLVWRVASWADRKQAEELERNLDESRRR